MARRKIEGPSLAGALPSDYSAVLESLKQRVQQTQARAMLLVSRELIRLYWDIGRLTV